MTVSPIKDQGAAANQPTLDTDAGARELAKVSSDPTVQGEIQILRDGVTSCVAEGKYTDFDTNAKCAVYYFKRFERFVKNNFRDDMDSATLSALQTFPKFSATQVLEPEARLR